MRREKLEFIRGPGGPDDSILEIIRKLKDFRKLLEPTSGEESVAHTDDKKLKKCKFLLKHADLDVIDRVEGFPKNHLEGRNHQVI